jgi:hypothetical protein
MRNCSHGGGRARRGSIKSTEILTSPISRVFPAPPVDATFPATLYLLLQRREISAIRDATFFAARFPPMGFLDRKDLEIQRTVKMQLRGEFFNILNHPNFDAFALITICACPALWGPRSSHLIWA